MTTHFVVMPSQETPSPLHVTEPVRLIDMKERRRERIAVLSKMINLLHKETLARLAK